MKKLFVVFLGVALVMSFAITAAEAGTDAGKIRLGASVAGFDWSKATYDGEPDDLELSTTTICIGCGAGLTVGYCIDENIEVGLNAQFAIVNAKMKMGDAEEDAPTVTEVGFAAYANYNYEAADKVVVFPEVLIGYTTSSIEDVGSLSGLMFGGGGGLKYFALENGSVDLGLNFIYGMLKDKPDAEGAEDTDVSGMELLFKVGVSLYLGGGE